jgi:hypothetical protein
MARMEIPSGSECRLSYTPGGSVQVQFCEASGAWTSPVMLHHASRIPNDVFSRGHRPMQPQKGRFPMQSPVHPAPVRNIPLPGVPTIAAPVPVAASLPNTPNVSMPGGSPMHRTYAPGIARFLSQVRLAEQLIGEHPYGYALNNPISYIDPWGLAPCPDPGGAKCCCQVVSFTTKTTPINNAFKVGHAFTINVTTQNVVTSPGGSTRGCTLHWLEKAVITANSHIPSNTWIDTDIPPYSQYFDPSQNTSQNFANSQPKDCPSAQSTYTFTDYPGFRKPLGTFPNGTRTATQKLCIRVVVTDGCSGKPIVRTFSQVIAVVNDKVVGLKPPGSAPGMAAYCKYP